MNVESPRILNIGQCQIDAAWMAHLLKRALGAVVEEAGAAREAVAKVQQARYQLILINRELDRDGSSGLSLVSDLLTLDPQTPIMLVSNFEAAQASAVKLGATPGFGKANMDSDETLDRIRKVLSSDPAPPPPPA